MSTTAPWLATASFDAWPAKARRLAQLAHAALPVPPGLVLLATPDVLDEPDVRDAVASLLERGPVVVRSALDGEDEAEGSAAGLGRSALDCTDLAGVRQALTALRASRDDPWLQAYRDRSAGDDRAIVQRQIERRALLVVALTDTGDAEVEVHTAGGEALAQGRTPEYAGRLAAWDDPACTAVQALLEQSRPHLPASAHGHDLELVVDPEGEVFLVQARPLTAALHPGWPAFREALAEAEQLPQLHGVLTLDAEHNPAPLSPAHTWLMGWLREQRPRAGDPTVLAGWLYVRTLPRDLAKARASSSSTSSRSQKTPPLTAMDAVQMLHRETIPQARERWQAVARLAAEAESEALVELLGTAQDAFLSMIDAYVGVLIPARTRARRALAGAVVIDRLSPLSTRGRGEFLGILPATWDLASPSLAELGAEVRDDETALPTDEASAATLLGEWDDHLFALGLAPLRAWYLATARRVGLNDDDAFMLHAPELVALLRDPSSPPTALIVTRRDALARQQTLRPPLRIENGHPVSFGRRARLRGIPLGSTFVGPLAPRTDLGALLRDPPPPGAIVTLPSLTAQAAVALQQLGVRAICSEHGGPLSHAALMARELGLSALIGCRGCTELPAGRRARLDTTTGRLLLAPADDDEPISPQPP